MQLFTPINHLIKPLSSWTSNWNLLDTIYQTVGILEKTELISINENSKRNKQKSEYL